MKASILFLFSCSLSSANAFSLLPITKEHASRRLVSSSSSLSGLLDDIMAEGEASSTTFPSKTRLNQEHEDLFHSLILSGDTRVKISAQLDKCTDASFCEYLTISIDNSNDEEETQGLQELINLIQEVNTEVAEQKAQVEAEATKAATDKEEMEMKREGDNGPSKIMSNAEVLNQLMQLIRP